MAERPGDLPAPTIAAGLGQALAAGREDHAPRADREARALDDKRLAVATDGLDAAWVMDPRIQGVRFTREPRLLGGGPDC